MFLFQSLDGAWLLNICFRRACGSFIFVPEVARNTLGWFESKPVLILVCVLFHSVMVVVRYL